jgi:hypothetical protein
MTSENSNAQSLNNTIPNPKLERMADRENDLYNAASKDAR